MLRLKNPQNIRGIVIKRGEVAALEAEEIQILDLMYINIYFTYLKICGLNSGNILML